jgi:hypothetical protein
MRGSRGVGLSRRRRIDGISRPAGRRGQVMREPTRRSRPVAAIRSIDTFARFGEVAPFVVHRGRQTWRNEDRRPAQQINKTKPMVIWERFVDYSTLDWHCRLSRNRQNEPDVNLDKICGLDRLVVSFLQCGETRQTNQTLPEWRPGSLASLVKNEQTNPTLPEWHPAGLGHRSRSSKRSHADPDGASTGRGAESTKRTQFGGERSRWFAWSGGERVAVVAFSLGKV